MAASAAQFAKSSTAILPLRELNKRSAQFGTWTVVVQQAQVEEYVYMWEGKKRTGRNLSCVLVSLDEPSEYCIGQMRWTSKTDDKFKKAVQKFQNGLASTNCS